MIYLHIYTMDKDIKIVSKIRLKENLTNYLKTDQFILEKNKNGKPITQGIHFSISHSKYTLVQAFCYEFELGVDVEFINHKRKYLKLAKRYFHPQEHNYMKSLSKNKAIKLFYDLWTAKEAHCKAHGGRLWYYLQDNYLNEKNQIVNSIQQHNIIQLNTINQFSLTIATTDKSKKIQITNE